MYEDGRGVPQSLDEAITWYMKVAIQGDTYAQDKLREFLKK